MKTPTSVKDKTEEPGSDNVGAILDDAMKQMKLAQHFPGKNLNKIPAVINTKKIGHVTLIFFTGATLWLAHL